MQKHGYGNVRAIFSNTIIHMRSWVELCGRHMPEVMKKWYDKWILSVAGVVWYQFVDAVMDKFVYEAEAKNAGTVEMVEESEVEKRATNILHVFEVAGENTISGDVENAPVIAKTVVESNGLSFQHEQVYSAEHTCPENVQLLKEVSEQPLQVALNKEDVLEGEGNDSERMLEISSEIVVVTAETNWLCFKCQQNNVIAQTNVETNRLSFHCPDNMPKFVEELDENISEIEEEVIRKENAQITVEGADSIDPTFRVATETEIWSEIVVGIAERDAKVITEGVCAELEMELAIKDSDVSEALMLQEWMMNIWSRGKIANDDKRCLRQITIEDTHEAWFGRAPKMLTALQFDDGSCNKMVVFDRGKFKITVERANSSDPPALLVATKAEIGSAIAVKIEKLLGGLEISKAANHSGVVYAVFTNNGIELASLGNAFREAAAITLEGMEMSDSVDMKFKDDRGKMNYDLAAPLQKCLAGIWVFDRGKSSIMKGAAMKPFDRGKMIKILSTMVS